MKVLFTDERGDKYLEGEVRADGGLYKGFTRNDELIKKSCAMVEYVPDDSG